MFNFICCSIALLIGGLWFWYSYRLATKNEELEERIKQIRSRLRIGAYNEALELTEIDYQYEADSVIDITDDENYYYEIILGNDRLYLDIEDDKNGIPRFNAIELTENGKTERLLTNEGWRNL